MYPTDLADTLAMDDQPWCQTNVYIIAIGFT